jgi:xylulokinase
VVEEGEACLMLGTAGNLAMPMRHARFDPRLIASHHVGCERWLSLGGTLCGGALEWFRCTFAPDLDFVRLEAEAEATAPATVADRSTNASAADLLVLPYFQGERTPVWDERARAVFFGIDLTHRRGHLYRALIDGIALGFRDCLAVAEELGMRFRRVVAANGAGKSRLLRQTLADALGVPLVWNEAGDATLRGAAVLAALGAGAPFPSPLLPPTTLESDLSVSNGKSYHVPNPREHERLEELFARRRALWSALRALFEPTEHDAAP